MSRRATRRSEECQKRRLGGATAIAHSPAFYHPTPAFHRSPRETAKRDSREEGEYRPTVRYLPPPRCRFEIVEEFLPLPEAECRHVLEYVHTLALVRAWVRAE